MNWDCPLLASVVDTHVQKLEEALIVWEAVFGLGQFSELAMHSLNGFGGLNDATYVVRIFELGWQVLPSCAPGLDHNRVFFSPA